MQDHDTLATISPVSHRLLTGEGLMSARLVTAFGAVVPRQLSSVEENGIVHRQSALHQAASGDLILDADLRIRREVCPAEILAALDSASALFGALLVEHGIAVDFDLNEIFALATADAPIRWGRRRRMVLQSNGQVLCDVEELLAPEDNLARMTLV